MAEVLCPKANEDCCEGLGKAMKGRDRALVDDGSERKRSRLESSGTTDPEEDSPMKAVFHEL